MKPEVRETNDGFDAYLGSVRVGGSDSYTHALAIAEAAEDYWEQYRMLRGFNPETVARPQKP